MTDSSRRPANLSWVAAAIGLFFLVLGLLLAKASRGLAMVPAYLAGAMVLLLALLGLGRAVFGRRRMLEQEQAEEYRRTHAATDLFGDADEAVRLAKRSEEHFLKYFVPFATMVLGAALVVTGLMLWRSWAALDANPTAASPLAMASLAALLALVAVVCGSYYVGVSREPGCRWLRPPGAWMFLSGILFILGAVVMLCEHFQKWPDLADYRLGVIGLGVLMVLGVELVLSFVIEFYRPRMPGEAERPLPESRLLALFTEPGGLARNVAASLDYQFGFQVSEVWFYRFLERTVVPFAVAMVLFMWLLTCLVTMEPHERGVRERFGRVLLNDAQEAVVLQPGLHVKLPWPFAAIRKFPVDQVQGLVIGYEPSAGETADPHASAESPEGSDFHGDVILWTGLGHPKGETNFVVPNAPQGTIQRDEAGAVSVSFLATSIPVYYRINGETLYDYAYRHRDPLELLRTLATREAVHYFATVDFTHVLGPGRAEAGRVLARNIQAAATRAKLGVEIVFVGMQALHPPVETGAAFDAVVGASEERHQRILEAHAYGIQRGADADGERARLANEAEAYRNERKQVSEAEAEQFQQQLAAYRASPRIFVLNSYLDVLENDAAHTRKYIVATRAASEVIMIDLQEKLRPDLLDLEFGETEK